jgi:ppGpp synthetase/RelA/SpoT-type nucleotidyltranferase
MADKNQKITPQEHRRQIAAYMKEQPHYETYARGLERVLSKACEVSIPERIVQARAKSVSSFAEKCVRKFDKYPDAVKQLTDLCGARIIVQTLSQVEAVKLFIEKNFEVLERDDKASLLGEDKFGYRDMHYLVRLKPGRAKLLGFEAREIKTIGNRVAEVQVRSVSQHAWADTLHDRTYKTPLKLSPEAKRTAALLAAVMEDGDRNFDRLTGEIDGMVANYTAYASRELVDKEIKTQELIFKNEQNREKKARLALNQARLLGPLGEHEKVVDLLKPFANIKDAVRHELLSELGHALCQVHADKPDSASFKSGQKWLEAVVAFCTNENYTTVPNLRKGRSLLARTYARLAHSWAVKDHNPGLALQYYRRATEIEPANPYLLANQLGFEILCARNESVVASMTTTIKQGIEVCRQHAIAGTELPYALLTAGRLSLLLGDTTNALGWYARGLRYLADGKFCVSSTVILTEEEKWIERLHFGHQQMPDAHDWVRRLIALARPICISGNEESRQANAVEKHVLILVGGASTIGAEMISKIKPVLKIALQHFRGTVISGGTKAGIPGCAGEIAKGLKAMGCKHFELVGYIPKHLPEDAPKCEGYDRFEIVSDDNHFSPGQILRTWEDLFREGISSHQVRVLGFGGGPLTAVEYRVAFALGATVAAVAETGGASDEILADSVWAATPRVISLPFDEASIQAFATTRTHKHEEEKLVEMAQAFHAHYLKDNPGKLPENMRPWEKLAKTYKTANLEQARYAVEIFRAAGFDVRPANSSRNAIADLSGEKFKKDVEKMARLEHGRWNVERLSNGWRPGRPRNDARKIHDCIVPWANLPDDIREYDRNSVRAFPEILAKAGLAIFRKSKNEP